MKVERRSEFFFFACNNFISHWYCIGNNLALLFINLFIILRCVYNFLVYIIRVTYLGQYNFPIFTISSQAVARFSSFRHSWECWSGLFNRSSFHLFFADSLMWISSSICACCFLGAWMSLRKMHEIAVYTWFCNLWWQWYYEKNESIIIGKGTGNNFTIFLKF